MFKGIQGIYREIPDNDNSSKHPLYPQFPTQQVQHQQQQQYGDLQLTGVFPQQPREFPQQPLLTTFF